MKYPITSESILKSVFIVEKSSGEKVSSTILEIAELLVQHINAAYISGYSDGLQASVKGESKL